jgi:hypothetical protein
MVGVRSTHGVELEKEEKEAFNVVRKEATGKPLRMWQDIIKTDRT